MRIMCPLKAVSTLMSTLLSVSLINIPKENKKYKDNKNNYEIVLNEEELYNNKLLKYYVIACENIKIYNEQSIKSKNIGLLVNGKSLELVEELDNNWYKVLFDDNIAYINSSKITIESFYNEPNKDNIPFLSEILNDITKVDMICATSRVNVREKETTKSTRISELNVNDELPLIKELNDWYEVNYYGKSAYVYKKYAKKTNDYFINSEIKDIAYVTRKTNLYDINDNKVIKSIPKNEAVYIYAKDENNYLVKFGGSLGLIPKKYTCSLGETCVIIDISSQNLKLFCNNKLIVDTQIVTGKESSPTYCGIFDIKKKEENVRWDEFNVTVKYWLPFNRGEGMHDASWRKDNEFGSEIYHKKGSHGCVNINKNIMYKIYSNVEIGTPVLVKK